MEKQEKELAVEEVPIEEMNPKVISALMFSKMVMAHRYRLIKENTEHGEEEFVLSKLTKKENEAYNSCLEFLKQYFNDESTIGDLITPEEPKNEQST